MNPDHVLTEDELAAIEELAAAATTGPWYVRILDDDHAANLVAVSTAPDAGHAQRWPNFDAGEIVAATLVQFPNRYANCADERWDENAQFIANARQDVPRLIAEVRRLKYALEQARPSNRATGEESNHNS